MHEYKPSKAQTLVALAVLLACCVGLAFHVGTGEYSSFGLGEFFLLCPLGGLEAILASRTFIPQALISLCIVTVLALLFGRSWCGWFCPASLVRSVFNVNGKQKHLIVNPHSEGMAKLLKNDTRAWVLVIMLVAALVVGFPVFCLICPIGLTFGTVQSVWRAIQFSEVNLGLLVFPTTLILELVVLKRWCIQICPIAALLSIAGHAAKLFRPQVKLSSCIAENGGNCNVCAQVCPEAIDLHSDSSKLQLADCTRCGACVRVCPTDSISMPVLAKENSDKQIAK